MNRIKGVCKAHGQLVIYTKRRIRLSVCLSVKDTHLIDYCGQTIALGKLKFCTPLP